MRDMLSLFYADTAIERLLCKTDGKTTIFVENETGGWFKFDPWFNTRWDNLPFLMRFGSITDLGEWMIWLDSVPIDTDCASRFENSINRFFSKIDSFSQFDHLNLNGLGITFVCVILTLTWTKFYTGNAKGDRNEARQKCEMTIFSVF